jgi:hypothetical protein
MTVRQHGITACIENITPAKARAYLATNTSNRKIRPRTVATYARDMEHGKWSITGEAIKFDTEDVLRDGQHRLAAVIEAGVTVPMLVVRGITPQAQRVMDSGIKRQVHDQLDIDGMKNSRTVAAAARLAIMEPGAGFTPVGKEQPSTAEVLEFIEAYAEELEQASAAAKFYGKAVPIPPSVMVLSWMNFVQIDPAACKEFFDAIKEQKTTGEGDPRLALSRRLTKTTRDRSGQERIPQRQALSLVYRAWNAWRAGNHMRSIPTHVRGEEIGIPEKLR